MPRLSQVRHWTCSLLRGIVTSDVCPYLLTNLLQITAECPIISSQSLHLAHLSKSMASGLSGGIVCIALSFQQLRRPTSNIRCPMFLLLVKLVRATYRLAKGSCLGSSLHWPNAKRMALGGLPLRQPSLRMSPSIPTQLRATRFSLGELLISLSCPH